MPFTRPTLSEIVSRIQSDIETRLPSIGSLLRRSILKVLARTLAGSIHLLYGYLDYQSDQVFATTADEDALNVMASEYGLTRTAATYATGSGTATGTTGTVIPSGSILQNGDGILYETNADYTIVGGTVTIYFTASEAGEDGNDDAGITLTFISPISGVNTTVTVSSAGITGGADEEENDNLRERILVRKRQPPHGGADFDYVNWAKEVSGVTRAWAYPQFGGNGTIGIAFVRDNDTTILPTSTLADGMLLYFESHTDPASGQTLGSPVGALPGIFIMSSDGMVSAAGIDTSYKLSELSVDFSIAVYPNTSSVQSAIESEIDSLFLSEGGPGQTLYLSRISEAIGSAIGELRHKIISPTSDVSASFNQVPKKGIVTFSSY